MNDPHAFPPGSTGDVVLRFNDALSRHDLAALDTLLADDTVFENTGPAPDGRRIEGKAEVRAFWARWMDAQPDARLDTEELVVAGERAVLRWVYRKQRDGAPWHLRGMDLFTVRRGQVVSKLSYVKG